MSNRKATRAALNQKVKTWAGLRYRRVIRESWDWSEDMFWQRQLAEFTRLYDFARNKVPYYRDRPAMYPQTIDTNGNVLDILAQLPIVTKQAVRDLNTKFWAEPLSVGTRFHTTSGTSGTPLRLPANVWERGFGQAVTEEWYERICGTRFPRTLNLSGFMTPSAQDKELYWIDRLSGHVFLSIYSMTRQNRDEVVRLLQAVRPQLIYGYASAVHQLALLLGEAVRDSKAERIAAVTSEVLQPGWRELMEGSLCRAVYDHYGSQEGCHRVLQCKENRMHIHPLVGVVEILNEQGEPARAGEYGRVVVTGLRQKSMPLIRYEIGDRAMSTGYATDCPCGLAWPTIGPIEGRSEDLIKTRDGRNIGYLCFHATKDLKGIKEAQLIQSGYENFVCNIVRSEAEQIENQDLESAIRAQLFKRLQMSVDVEFRYLSRIPRGSNGKFKAVIVDMDGRPAQGAQGEARHV